MSSACQELVYLDVGGTPFKMLRTTVQNNPDSLIAKILKACPQAGQKSQPLYVDRSPKLFDWILEVYRCTSEDAFPSCKSVISETATAKAACLVDQQSSCNGSLISISFLLWRNSACRPHLQTLLSRRRKSEGS